MVIHFESFGNFATGHPSYLALISKKSRGSIKLTEKGFLFKSDKDKILFQIKLSDINNFYIKKRFKLPTIELISKQGTYFTFYPHKKEKTSYSTSKKLTKELFRQLTRLAFKNEKNILFEANGICWEENYETHDNKLRNGIIFLTEDYLSFKPFNKGSVHQIRITEISRIVNNVQDSSPNVKIQTEQDKNYSYSILKKKLGKYTQDKSKNMKFFNLIHQAKEYKVSEQIERENEERERIERLKSLLQVSNRLRLDMIRIALDMEEKEFTNKVFEWADKFKFVIDGDYLIVNYDTMSDFLDNLSSGFPTLKRAGIKIKCRNCNNLIDFNAKICPKCGKDLN
ncbi:MAG: zinc ribbon domain-containing protein [Candidatus Hodarchaeota archaeon]